MFNKLERYVSKNTPQTALQLVKEKMSTVPKTYQNKPLTDTTIYNWYGFIQRKNIEPTRFLPTFNKQRIGYHQRSNVGPSMHGESSMSFTESSMNRVARITFGETNHMQSTPSNKRGRWNIQIESSGWARSHGMLWFRCGDDAYHKWGDRDEIRSSTIEGSISMAETMGLEYEIIYPHERYHQTKSYADNFVFNKESVSDVEDNDEIFSVAKNLV